jgi:hypothetical protein
MGFNRQVELLWQTDYAVRTIRLTESDMVRIVSESVRRIVEDSTGGFETYYRGYNSKYGSQKGHMLWITADISYARAYGNRVEKIIIDKNKLRLVSIYEIDEIIGREFDYYEGLTEDEARLVIESGYNGYGFEANNDSSYCICLFDSSPIVSRRELSQEEFEEIEEYEGFDNNVYGDDY